MKTVILMRHGKSSWEHNLTDRERPLKPRGIRDSSLVAKEFVKYLFLPELVFCSPAMRAKLTCENFLVSTEKTYKTPEIIEDLYDFGGQKVINFVNSLDDTYKSVIIFGHNFAFTNIANLLGDKYIDNLPTAGLVAIEFDTNEWKNLQNGRTKLVLIPKELR